MSPDPNAEYWTVDEVAEYAGLAHLTIIQYHGRGQMPYRDRRSKTLLWKPERIRRWRPPAVAAEDRLICVNCGSTTMACWRRKEREGLDCCPTCRHQTQAE